MPTADSIQESSKQKMEANGVNGELLRTASKQQLSVKCEVRASWPANLHHEATVFDPTGLDPRDECAFVSSEGPAITALLHPQSNNTDPTLFKLKSHTGLAEPPHATDDKSPPSVKMEEVVYTGELAD
ncbi:hypothetical protein FRC07_010620 [Ceratobasidium sp. 392]|nr:hypothetical protein FRC07_010620 [Ceratobasidium sp. 392]